MTLPVILYRYNASPFAHKVDNILLLKGIPHQRVQVSPILPRPEISEELGIHYRRIPLLAIGNDVYCDTSLVASALERRFSTNKGHGTLFPTVKNGKSADTGSIKLFSKFYADNVLFNIASVLVPWEKLPPQLVKDRGEFKGAPINTAALVAYRENIMSQLSSHLALLEEQLSDGREWLFDTAAPGLADISVHFIYTWAKSLKTADALFSEKRFNLTFKWLDRVSRFLSVKQKEQATPTVLKGGEAAKAIFASTHEPDSVVGFDAQEGKRLRVQLGGVVSVVPDDTGRNHPTTGKLVALNLSEVVLEIKAKKGTLRCHFPRLGYVIKGVNNAKL